MRAALGGIYAENGVAEVSCVCCNVDEGGNARKLTEEPQPLKRSGSGLKSGLPNDGSQSSLAKRRSMWEARHIPHSH